MSETTIDCAPVFSWPSCWLCSPAAMSQRREAARRSRFRSRAPSRLAARSSATSHESLHCDHGYVEYQIPVNPRRINLVMWHSAAATAWMNRWDGGEGYQSIFLRRGYPVYIWDGPQVGRANWGCVEHTYQPRHGPGSGQLHRVAIRREVPGMVRGHAVPEGQRRSLESGIEGTLPRVRQRRERAAAVGCRCEADGQDRPERRAHQFRGRPARHPDGAQDEQPGRHRDVRERRLRLSAGGRARRTGGRVRSRRGSARGVQEADEAPDADGLGRQHRQGRQLFELVQAVAAVCREGQQVRRQGARC